MVELGLDVCNKWISFLLEMDVLYYHIGLCMCITHLRFSV